MPELWSFTKELELRRDRLNEAGFNAYCLFCLPGIEATLCKQINTDFEYALALPIMKMSHKSREGIKYDVQEQLLSSYIFIYLPIDKDIFEIKTPRFYFKVLKKETDKGILIGNDLEYAKLILEAGGLISVSEAIKYSGKVKIVNGPLKKLEGKIVEYSKRNRNCCVEIELLNRTIRTWLPFDWVDTK